MGIDSSLYMFYVLGFVQDYIAKHGTNIDEDPGWPEMEQSGYLLKPIGKETRKMLLAKKREFASSSGPSPPKGKSAKGVPEKKTCIRKTTSTKTSAKQGDSKKAIHASGSSSQNMEAKIEAEDEKNQGGSVLGRIG